MVMIVGGGRGSPVGSSRQSWDNIAELTHGVRVSFLCHFTGPQCPDIWLNRMLGVNVRVFLGEGTR